MDRGESPDGQIIIAQVSYRGNRRELLILLERIDVSVHISPDLLTSCVYLARLVL
jgi:hypothetical protein